MQRDLLILSFGALLGACTAQPGAPLLPAAGLSVERGAGIARAKCSSCHAVGWTGASPSAAAPPLREVATEFNQLMLERHLVTIAEKGHFEMPPRQFRKDEIPNIVAYINSLERAPGS